MHQHGCPWRHDPNRPKFGSSHWMSGSSPTEPRRPICEPWCWNMNPNICPCPKSPSFVGKIYQHHGSNLGECAFTEGVYLLLLSLPLVPDANQVQIFGGAVRLCTLSEFASGSPEFLMIGSCVAGEFFEISRSPEIESVNQWISVDQSHFDQWILSFSYLQSHFAEVSLGVYIDGNWQFDSFHREIGCSLKDRGG